MKWLPNGLVEHNLERPWCLEEVDEIYDIGAGLRPQQWYQPERHLCVEPCRRYAEVLRKAGFEVVQETAADFLSHAERTDAIYLLDVIEHMQKEVALDVIQMARRKVKKQLVIFTPFGFMEQNDDGWGYGEDSWQKHRSGWLPEEFPDYRTWRYARGFFAVFTK